MKKEDLENLTKEELIKLVEDTEAKFASSNVYAAELVISIEEANQELKDTHEALMQKAKLSTLGRIVSDICHDIANPLAITTGFLGFLEKSDSLVGKERDFLERSIYGAKRAQKIVDHLRTYVRKNSEEDVADFDLKEVLQGLVDFFSTQLTSNGIEVRTKLDQSIVTRINGTNFESVLQNLIVNSRDAFNDNAIENKKIDIELSETDGHITLIYQDTAGGIPEKHMDKVFSDFFTTKKSGHGTGLGLAMVKKVITGLGGTIDLEVDHGIGTKFIIKFPQIASEDKAPETFESVENFFKTNKLSMLLVDDEPFLLEAMELTLCHHFAVTATHQPKEALELLDKQNFDIILSDMAMGEYTGHQIISVPNIPTDTIKLIISGHVSTHSDLDKIQDKVDAVINKPLPDLPIFLKQIYRLITERQASSRIA